MSEIEGEEAIESPCVRNCCLDTDDICMGCFRSVDEIVSWGAASNEEKKAVFKRTEQRRAVRPKSSFK